MSSSTQMSRWIERCQRQSRMTCRRNVQITSTICSDETGRRPAFTLVELLVVISIIAVLVALLLPAIQAAREAARRTSCQNNLKQLALALHGFHDSQRVFPASGWTTAGPGNPSGVAMGWRAAILPHLEQSPLHGKYDFGADWWRVQNLQIGTIQLPLFQCPSTPERRSVTFGAAKSPRPAMNFDPAQISSDYEALMGVQKIVDPVLYATADTNRAVIFRNSRCRMADIRDGTTSTIMTTECSGRPRVYRANRWRDDLVNEQGLSWIDSESAFSLDGTNADGSLTGLGPTLTPHGINVTNENEPFSFHSGGAYFTFADGHVSMLNEEISLAVLAALATRAAGEVTEL